MKLSWDEIQVNAISFSKKWEKAQSEEAEAQPFEMAFFQVFGVDSMKLGTFEYKVPLSDNKTGSIDYLWKGKITIEMKSKGGDLKKAFEQLQNYMVHLPADETPDLWMVCDFENIWLNRRSTSETWKFKTKHLHKYIKRFANIAGYETERIRDNQVEVNIKAAEKMAKLHDALKSHGYEGHDLEVYLVRLLFCMFADDTGIFSKDIFTQYIENSKKDGTDLSHRISNLFEVLNMPPEILAKKTLLNEELKQFRYINGGLFADLLPSAVFNEKMRQALLDCAEFDWSKISPAIFGAMFQGVMDKKERRELGAHYTSEENILKLINPLFLDELYKEFEKVKSNSTALEQFHNKISQLKFLDPACGCGNFLIITYRELRKLELEVLKMKHGTKQLTLDIEMSNLLKVNVEQFYGIEYEDFPCQIATVGMWLIDHQMNQEVSELFGRYHDRLPLKQSATIVHANALRIDWESVVARQELSYILGNPPFVGARLMSAEQKEDMLQIFGKKFKSVGNLDYVTAWYKKAADYTSETFIKCAFVSTNSITQGEQVALLWKQLIEKGISINFGISTFIWNNEAKGKAAVYCVIVGFSYLKTTPNINPYLIKAPNIFIENRTLPISDAPRMNYGSFALDDNNYTISNDEYGEIIDKEPNVKQFLRPFIGARELLHNEKRYCIWLLGTNPTEVNKCSIVRKKIENVRSWRAKSSRKNTVLLADTPMLFAEIRQPNTTYLAIPTVSSEKRKYIPIAYLPSKIIASNQLYVLSNATLYHFGILTSNVHMAWTRAICGRLEMRYRYSKDIVYNNFPWADANDDQKSEIEKLAQAVLDAREIYPDSSLADLYDPLTMPAELLKAHKELDKAVMKLYGFSADTNESEIVASLMARYQQLTGK